MPLDPQARATWTRSKARLRGPAHDHPGRVASPGADPSRPLQHPAPADRQNRGSRRPEPGRGDPDPRLHAGRASPLPILVHYHGGGWVIGSVDQSDNLCRAMANATPCIVVSVEYRLAPETRFQRPGGLLRRDEMGRRARRRAWRRPVGWPSAARAPGGNLAAAVALLARERGGPEISSRC